MIRVQILMFIQQGGKRPAGVGTWHTRDETWHAEGGTWRTKVKHGKPVIFFYILDSKKMLTNNKKIF